MAEIHFPAYLQVSKDCLYHNTCVLFTALLTKIISCREFFRNAFYCRIIHGETKNRPLSPEGFYYGKKKSPSQQLCSHSFIAKGFSYIKGEYENLIERKGDGENLSLSFAYMDIIHHDY